MGATHTIGSLSFPLTVAVIIMATIVIGFVVGFDVGMLWNRLATATNLTRAAWFAVSLLIVSGAGVGAWALFLRPIAVQVTQIERDVPVQVFGLGTVEARVTSKVGFGRGSSTEASGRVRFGYLSLVLRRGCVSCAVEIPPAPIAEIAKMHLGSG